MTVIYRKSAVFAAALLGLATPALAQDALCGGAGTGGRWIAGDEAASDIATAPTYQEQMAVVLGGIQSVSLFTLSEGAEIRVEAEGRGAGDPVIDLLNADGGMILSDDDSGGNGAARAETFLDPGTYCMSLRSYDGGPMTAFVRIGRVEHEPLTDGVTTEPEGGAADGACDTATPMGGLGSTVSASVTETPYWSFTLDAPTPVSITAENEAADPVLTLYDADQNYLDENDDYDGLNSRLDMSDPLQPGTYCIGLDALSDADAPITVSLTAYDPEAALLALYARGEAAPPLDGTIAVNDLGELQSRTRQDVQASTEVTWFSVAIPETGLIVVEAIGAANSDPWLVVYDDLGREIGQNDDHGENLDSLVTARVERGTYIIGVKQYEGQGLIRLLVERYVRAQ